MGRLNQRLAAAALVFALVCCLSYAGQRLWDARTEPAIGTVTMQATIPYFWRLSITALHGSGAAALTFWGLAEGSAERLLQATPWLLPLVVLPAAILMLLVP